MTYSISQADPATLTTEEIHEEIASFAVLAAEVVDRWAVLLAELSKRRAPHPMFRHPVMQFWKSIAEKTLSPKAAVLLADRQKGVMIRAVLPLSIWEQESIAEGQDIAVAVRTETGDIKTDYMPIHRMSPDTIRRAFGPDGIRSIEEQTDMLLAEGKIQRIGAITVLRDEVALKIGNSKIKPEELKGPLAALGYSLSLTRTKGDAA